jgi:nitroreductase
MTIVDTPRWAAVADTIRERRSNLNVDLERPVARELIDELIDLALVAPNHYRTHPWRFVVLQGEARARIGAIAADALAAKGGEVPASVLERQRTQFLRAPPSPPASRTCCWRPPQPA